MQGSIAVHLTLLEQPGRTTDAALLRLAQSNPLLLPVGYSLPLILLLPWPNSSRQWQALPP